jgi:hypothetical protein
MACGDLATVIGESVLASAAGSRSGAQKRKKIKPVVTMPPLENRKRHRGSGGARVASWLHGCLESRQGVGSAPGIYHGTTSRGVAGGHGNSLGRGHMSGCGGLYVNRKDRAAGGLEMTSIGR